MLYQKLLFILGVTILLVFNSCGWRKAKPDPLVTAYYNEDGYESGKYIDVPFTSQGGVRYIQVKINDCTEFPMIFDTGCSGMSISLLELATLIKHGYVTEDDILGTARTQIADGSIMEEQVVNLRNVRIGDYQCDNVYAIISENMSAPLLLGNNALKNVESFSVDDVNQIIRFYLR